MYPLILICGNAGSGKDTFADLICSQEQAVKIALADPIKQFVGRVWKIEDDVLWGPSELRNKKLNEEFVDRRFMESRQYDPDYLERWMKLVSSESTDVTSKELYKWFRKHIVGRDLTVRDLLQKLATEFARSRNPDVWIDVGLKTAHQLLSTQSVYGCRSGVCGADGLHNSLVVISDGRFRNEILKVKAQGGYVVKIIDPHAKKSDKHQSETELDTVPEWWFNEVIVNDKTERLSMEILAARVENMLTRFRELGRFGTDTFNFR